jgi:hypothetical protein
VNFGAKCTELIGERAQASIELTQKLNTQRIEHLLQRVEGFTKSLNPERLDPPRTGLTGMLYRNGEDSLLFRVADRFGLVVTEETRIQDFLSTEGQSRGIVEEVQEDLLVQAEAAKVSHEQLSGEAKTLHQYRTAIKLSIATLGTVYNRTVGALEDLSAAPNQGIQEVMQMREVTSALERLDRRITALDASERLAEIHGAQVAMIRESLERNVELLTETANIVIPHWKSNLGLALAAMQSRQHTEIVQTFRKISDQLATATSDLISDINAQHVQMASGTFISAKTLANLYKNLAAHFSGLNERTIEARNARAAGIQEIIAAREEMVRALAGSTEELVRDSTVPVSMAINDRAAALLESAIN